MSDTNPYKKARRTKRRGAKDYARDAALILTSAGFPDPTREYIFHEPEEGEKKRLWRLDLAYVNLKIGIELHGIGHPKRCLTCKQPRAGRHHTIPGFREDRVKVATCQLQGWIVLECTMPEHLTTKLLEWTRKAFLLREKQRNGEDK